MRFLHLIGTLDPAAGGPSESVRLLLSDGYSGEAVTADAPDAPWVSSYNFPVHGLGPTRHRYGYTPRMRPWLRENLHRFDCVVVNGLWGYIGLATLLEVAGRKPYFVFCHGMLDPWFKHHYPAKHIKKWIYWTLVERRLLARATYVLFTSSTEARLAKESFGSHVWRELVVPYGTGRPPQDSPALREAFSSRCPGLNGQPFLLYLGRLHPKKGCDLLIEAFARVASLAPDLQLVMAGPDDIGWAAELRQMAARLGIADRVQWPGMLQQEAKFGAFYSADAFVLPSHQENFGIAVAESLSCGTPALLSDQVNIATDVAGDGAGFAAPDTLEGTESLLRSWLQLTPQARCAMRSQALRTAEARYRMDRTAALLTEFVKRTEAGDPAAPKDV